MRFHLGSWTEILAFVVFDPGAVPELLGAPLPRPGVLEEAARQGRLHVLDPGERGILVRFYVDEEPAEDLAGRRRGDAREGVLDVPTGRLFLASVEHLGNWNEAERT